MAKKPFLVLGLVIGLGGAVAGSVLAANSNSPVVLEQTPSPYSGALPPAPDGGIFYGGIRVSLAEAEEALPYPLFRPHDVLASDATITKVWTERQNGDSPTTIRAAIKYASGVLVKVEPEWIGVPQVKAPCEDPCLGTDDPPASFAEMAQRLADQLASSEVPAASFLATVKGDVAFVTPMRVGISPGSVMFSYQGVRITIFGDLDQPTLLRLAESAA